MAYKAINTGSPSLNPFLNALVREWDGWRFISGAATPELFEPDAIVLELGLAASGARALIETRHRSKVGYHDFASPVWLVAGLGAPSQIDFAALLALLLREPSIAGRASELSRLTFVRRTLASVAAAGEVSVARGAARPFATVDPDFIEAESALRFGHAVHPAPMSRDEFTRTDSERYGHEYGNGFQLRWWAVDPALLSAGSVEPLDAVEMAAGLAGADRELAERAGRYGGKVQIPMHPWQAVRLHNEEPIDRLFRDGRLADLGLGGPQWRATTSLRTIHSKETDWMLKFSLSLRLTNSRRIVEERECQRGLSVHRLIKGELGAALKQRCPTMNVLGEPAWLGLRDANGRLMTDTIVSFRENPFKGGNAAKAAVLGALCERHPGTTESHVSDLVRRISRDERRDPTEVAKLWFGRFLKVAVEPFIIAFSEFGLLFGAHQQNLVVGLEQGWPEALYFRDCQGTGYVKEFLPQLRQYLPEAGQAGDHVFPASEAARLFGYYLVINGVFAVVSAFAAAGIVDEDELLAIFQNALQALSKQKLSDRSCVDYLLDTSALLAKGNFLIALRDINENTEVTDPLAGYVDLPNPLHAREWA